MVRASILGVVMAAGCAGPAQLGVSPSMTEMPIEAERRDHLLDTATARPTAESRKPLTRRERKAQTAAATAAAVVGWLMSSHPNTVLGVSGPIDENLIFQDHRRRPTPDPARTPEERPPVLIPWIDLGKP